MAHPLPYLLFPVLFIGEDLVHRAPGLLKQGLGLVDLLWRAFAGHLHDGAAQACGLDEQARTLLEETVPELVVVSGQ